MNRSVIGVCSVLLAFCLVPAMQAAELDLASAKAGTYKVDSYHTQVGFSISHFGFTNYHGLFSGATGGLQLDPGKLGAAKLDVALQVNTISTTVPQLTEELKGDKWFDTAKYPTATFSSTKVVPTAKGVTVTGKPIVLDVRFVGAGVNPITKAYTVGFEATTTIKRSEYGVTTYVPAIGDDVQLTIAGAFEQQS